MNPVVQMNTRQAQRKINPKAAYQSLHPWFPYLFSSQGECQADLNHLSLRIKETSDGADISWFCFCFDAPALLYSPPPRLLAVLQSWLPRLMPPISSLIRELDLLAQGSAESRMVTRGLEGWITVFTSFDSRYCLCFARTCSGWEVGAPPPLRSCKLKTHLLNHPAEPTAKPKVIAYV